MNIGLAVNPLCVREASGVLCSTLAFDRPCGCSLEKATMRRLCEKCDGKCVVCDSYVRPATLVRVCDECNYGSYSGRCVICGGIGISDAYYCKVFPAGAPVVSMFERFSPIEQRQCLPLRQSPPRKERRVPFMYWTQQALSFQPW